MTKQEFVDKVAQKANLSRRDAAEAVDAVLDSITDTLRSGGEVNFTGFGKFSTQHRKERQGVNPRNPTEKVTIPAATVPKFSAGSTLKTAVKTGGGGGGGQRHRAELGAGQAHGIRLDLGNGLGDSLAQRAEQVGPGLEAVLVEVVARAPPRAEQKVALEVGVLPQGL